MEKKEKLSEIRNVGIMAHIDAGKTTVTEKILYLCGETHNIGKVHEGNAQMDFMDEEKKRGITIQSAAITIFWKEKQINIIDTPGHVDFTAEVERSLRVLDGGIVVIDGSKGVQAQTETVWKQANKYKIPRLIFVNKMDNADNEKKFDESLISIKKKLNVCPFAIQIPIGSGKDLKGVVDIIEEKAFYFQIDDKEENYEEKEIPNYLKKKTKEIRQELIEKIIEYDEDLALFYLEGGKLKIEEIRKLIRNATLSGNFFPVLCGSAYKNVGVKLILDSVNHYLPSPFDVKQITTFFSNGTKNDKIIKIGDKISCLALAFKIVIDEYNNRLTFIRVYVGKILSNSYIYNCNRNKVERVSRIMRIQANKKKEIKEIKEGDIAAIIGLENTMTGDTICDKENPLILETIKFTEPVISQAIEPETNEDKNRLGISLKKIKEQDPSFNYWINKETNQMIISGMGELHLEILISRLKKEHKLKLKVKKPEVSYRETIKNKVEIKYLHKKQTGGAGERAEVHLIIEPNEEKGFTFIDSIKGEAIPKQFRSAVKSGLESVLSQGYLLGYPIVDIKITLIGGDWHPVDSSYQAFERAGYNSFKENINKFFFILLEPFMKIEIEIPKEYYGNILGDLTSRRGEIENINEDKEPIKIYAKIPLAEIFGYSTILRSLTKGRGIHSTNFSHYKEVPSHILEKIKKK